MNRIVKSISFFMSINRLMTWAWMDTSRAETGSSAMITDGFTTRERAIPILCLWPPENSWG